MLEQWCIDICRSWWHHCFMIFAVQLVYMRGRRTTWVSKSPKCRNEMMQFVQYAQCWTREMNTVHPLFAGIDYCRYYDSMLIRFVLCVQAEVIVWLLQTIAKQRVNLLQSVWNTDIYISPKALRCRPSYRYLHFSKSITLSTVYDVRQHAF